MALRQSVGDPVPLQQQVEQQQVIGSCCSNQWVTQVPQQQRVVLQQSVSGSCCSSPLVIQCHSSYEVVCE